MRGRAGWIAGGVLSASAPRVDLSLGTVEEVCAISSSSASAKGGAVTSMTSSARCSVAGFDASGTAADAEAGDRSAAARARIHVGALLNVEVRRGPTMFGVATGTGRGVTTPAGLRAPRTALRGGSCTTGVRSMAIAFCTCAVVIPGQPHSRSRKAIFVAETPGTAALIARTAAVRVAW